MQIGQSTVQTEKARRLGMDLLTEMSRQSPNMDDVSFLIKQGANLSVTDKNGLTPLLRAMGWGNMKILKEMLEHGADVNLPQGSSQMTPLQVALCNQSAEVIRLFLDAGGDVFLKNAEGRSALDLASKKADPAIFPMVEARAQAQKPDYETAEQFAAAVKSGLPVKKPFPAMKQLALKRRI